MKNTISKKSAFVISICYRQLDLIKNPLPGKTKTKLKSHEISLFVLAQEKEVITFLNQYTKFSSYNNNDNLEDKKYLKESTRFIIEIEDYEKFKKEILCDPPRGFVGADFLEKEYNEKYISIDRLPTKVGKRHLYEDLY